MANLAASVTANSARIATRRTLQRVIKLGACMFVNWDLTNKWSNRIVDLVEVLHSRHVRCYFTRVSKVIKNYFPPSKKFFLLIFEIEGEWSWFILPPSEAESLRQFMKYYKNLNFIKKIDFLNYKHIEWIKCLIFFCS